MKKKLLGVITIAVVVMFAGYNVYISESDTNMSDLVLSNVEALANSRETTPYDCYMSHCCYNPSSDCFGHSDRWYYCPDMRGY